MMGFFTRVCCVLVIVFFFKQKTAYEMRISDWSSDVCSSDLGILVNIFGGIMRCDIIADGIIAAAKEVQLSVPLVVRLEGTNVEEGKNILAESGLPIVAANDLGDAARKIVAQVKNAA